MTGFLMLTGIVTLCYGSIKIWEHGVEIVKTIRQKKKETRKMNSHERVSIRCPLFLQK